MYILLDPLYPLHAAASDNNHQLLRSLLTARGKGADINKNNANGKTPLHIAAQKNASACVSLLIQEGADVDKCCDSPASPLHRHKLVKESRAGTGRWCDICKVKPQGLHDWYSCRPCDYNECPSCFAARQGVTDDNGMSSLHLAARNNASECLTLLIQKGADIHKTANSGWTALHVAGKHNAIDCISLLIQAGADINQPVAALLICNCNHRLVKSTFSEDGYRNGFECDKCQTGSPPQTERYWCQLCTYDVCLKCAAAILIDDGTSLFSIAQRYGHSAVVALLEAARGKKGPFYSFLPKKRGKGLSELKRGSTPRAVRHLLGTNQQ